MEVTVEAMEISIWVQIQWPISSNSSTFIHSTQRRSAVTDTWSNLIPFSSLRYFTYLLSYFLREDSKKPVTRWLSSSQSLTVSQISSMTIRLIWVRRKTSSSYATSMLVGTQWATSLKRPTFFWKRPKQSLMSLTHSLRQPSFLTSAAITKSKFIFYKKLQIKWWLDSAGIP